jgi:hypothetical protein
MGEGHGATSNLGDRQTFPGPAFCRISKTSFHDQSGGKRATTLSKKTGISVRTERHCCGTALLTAIVKARGWIDDIRLGRITSFAEIYKREVRGERHIRLLAPLAFVSPRIVGAILDGTAPEDLTVTGLAKCLPYSWADQEQSIGLLQ